MNIPKSCQLNVKTSLIFQVLVALRSWWYEPDIRAVGKLLYGSLAAVCLPAAFVLMNPTDNF